jgi:non-specific serine/threonine protein kinase
MELLLLLLEHRQELVSHDDIAKRLWGEGTFGDLDAGTHSAVLRIRQALGDSRESPSFVETVPGKGYRFVAPVDVVCLPHHQELPETQAEHQPLPDACRHNLPAELTSFVGRQNELAELPRVLRSARLLSLTGSGGVGKTRLGVRLGFQLMHEFPDGVWLVDLAPLSDPDLVAQTVAIAVGVREGQRSARDALLENLRNRQLLLVLDNCEHVIVVCAELVEALLRGAPGLRILATSREALGVPGETVYRVPSLSLPESTVPLPSAALIEAEATRLFVERATAVDLGSGRRRGMPTRSRGSADVSMACRSRSSWPPSEYPCCRSSRSTRGLQDRFRLLTGGTRTVVARQRTLEATVDWSYQLLSSTERQVLSRLSVFRAGWSLEAAEKVCAGDGIDASDMLDLLSGLVAKSLVGLECDAAGGRRYVFLETVRQFARDRLVEAGDADRLRHRHFEFFFEEFREVLPILRHHDQLPCLRRLRTEQENVRAALECALTSPSSPNRESSLLARSSGSGQSAVCSRKEGSGSNGRSPVPPTRRHRCERARCSVSRTCTTFKVGRSRRWLRRLCR